MNDQQFEIFKYEVYKEIDSTNEDPGIRSIKRQFFDKLICFMEFENGELLINAINVDAMDQQIIEIGKIEHDTLIINIGQLLIKCELFIIIVDAMIKRKSNIIRCLINRDVDLSSILPDILIECIETQQYDLLKELIDKKYPIDVRDYLLSLPISQIW